MNMHEDAYGCIRMTADGLSHFIQASKETLATNHSTPVAVTGVPRPQCRAVRLREGRAVASTAGRAKCSQAQPSAASGTDGSTVP